MVLLSVLSKIFFLRFLRLIHRTGFSVTIQMKWRKIVDFVHSTTD